MRRAVPSERAVLEPLSTAALVEPAGLPVLEAAERRRQAPCVSTAVYG